MAALKSFKQVSIVVAWNLTLLLIGAVVIELIFGSWFTAPKLWSLSIMRDVDYEYSAATMYERSDLVHFSRDAFGLRGDYERMEDVNIIAIGGSTTDEGGVSDDEAWPHVMQECLRSKSIAATVANAGIGGQTSRGHAMNFRVWLNHVPGLAPLLAVVFIGYNDNRVIPENLDLDDVTAYLGNEPDPEYRAYKAFRKWVKISSAFYGLYRIIKGNIRAMRLGLGPLANRAQKATDQKVDETGVEKEERLLRERWHDSIVIGSPKFHERKEEMRKDRKNSLDAYRKRLELLEKAAREFGTIAVFVTQHSGRYRLDEIGTLRGMVDGFIAMDTVNDITRDYCAVRNLFCIDLASELFFSANDIYDGIHTTPKGSRKIGMKICEKLAEWPDWQKLTE